MKESQTQSAIEQYLRILENQGKLVYQKNNSGAFRTERGSFIRYGKAGSPDFLVFLKDGACLHLEIKNEKGELTKNQLDYALKMDKLGHCYEVARSLDEVEKMLKKRGC
jgi:hypothetical protein